MAKTPTMHVTLTLDTAGSKAIAEALAELPAECRYHGTNIECTDDPWRYSGACCATGEKSLKHRRAERALTFLRAQIDRPPVVVGDPETDKEPK